MEWTVLVLAIFFSYCNVLQKDDFITNYFYENQVLIPNIYHSVSKCPISFGNWFWHLIVGNRSIVLNFYQQRPVFALKNHPRPQRPKRPMKANKGQHSPKLQISLLLSIFNVNSSTNVNKIPEKCVFKKLKISISTT